LALRLAKARALSVESPASPCPHFCSRLLQNPKHLDRSPLTHSRQPQTILLVHYENSAETGQGKASGGMSSRVEVSERRCLGISPRASIFKDPAFEQGDDIFDRSTLG